MKTIKELQEELKKTKEDREFYFSKYYKLKEEKEKSERNKMINVQSEKDELSNQAKNLLEIIRWLIKPETAKSPFMPNKSERDEGKNRF